MINCLRIPTYFTVLVLLKNRQDLDLLSETRLNNLLQIHHVAKLFFGAKSEGEWTRYFW